MNKIPFIFIYRWFYRSLLISRFQVVIISYHGDINSKQIILVQWLGESMLLANGKLNVRKNKLCVRKYV